MPGLRAIFFDVMDTLVRDPFHVEMPSFLGMTKAELIAKKHPTAWVDFELGRIDEATFLAIFLPDHAWDAQGFRAHVHDSYAWLPGVEAILAELRSTSPDVTLHALSNYPPWYDVIAERCGLDRYLSSAFVSHRLGVRKPDPEAYLAPCRSLGIDPRDALFVDDRKTNCDAARAVGMDAIVFTGAPALRADLAARRLVR